MKLLAVERNKLIVLLLIIVNDKNTYETPYFHAKIHVLQKFFTGYKH